MADRRSDVGPFAIIPEWVVASGVSQTALLVYFWLARHASDEDGTAWPSRQRLAELAGVSTRTVTRAIAELEAAGALTVTARYTATGGQTSNRYVVRFADPSSRASNPPDIFVQPPLDTVVQQNDNHVEREPLEQTPLSTAVDFDAFWHAYPKRSGRRVGKAAAKAKWQKLVQHHPAIMTATNAYAAAVGRGETIAKDAQRFLAGDYWRDWLPGAEADEMCRSCDIPHPAGTPHIEVIE